MKKRKWIAIVCVLCLVCQMQPVSAKTQKVRLSKTSVTIKNGKTLKLKLKNYNKKIKWISSNTNIVSVNAKGKIRGMGLGNAVIKAKAGKKTYKCQVTVRSDVDAQAVVLDYKNSVFTKELYSRIKSVKADDAVVTDKAAIKKIYSYYSALELRETDTPIGIFANGLGGPIIDGSTFEVFFFLDDDRCILVDQTYGQLKVYTDVVEFGGKLSSSSKTLYDIVTGYIGATEIEGWIEKNKEIQ